MPVVVGRAILGRGGAPGTGWKRDNWGGVIGVWNWGYNIAKLCIMGCAKYCVNVVVVGALMGRGHENCKVEPGPPWVAAFP
jgi:hypothetical protein